MGLRLAPPRWASLVQAPAHIYVRNAHANAHALRSRAEAPRIYRIALLSIFGGVALRGRPFATLELLAIALIMCWSKEVS